ncbi:4,5-DOPA-extradiol-dioxygenase [Jiulongibacter sediminis]|uniref:Dioxygenase n=1 Tax=Jiulongibacter sediminis TaxID=1605367 RepID=A0A0P7BUI4_9BACT|nr:4,5-DOPA dioxygenase extradiol [Jiulongibacter sediminis]KPM48447.1 dioxygenase [Jiulongibacter sediminis]TBX24985.1 dioxygenase [Jiulongibacter sediminis]
MNSLHDLKNLSDTLPRRAAKMPVLFVGHGSPMNAIEDNEFSLHWEKMGKTLPEPSAVLVISAHWLSKGTKVTAMENPKTIHDFGGFPKELFEVEYPAPGLPSLALETKNLIQSTEVELDHDWGLDHGTWSVVRRMFPEAKIPVLQLSIDYPRTGQYHYDLGKELAALREKGVLIIGSGNMIHNLRMVYWEKLNEPNFGYDWAHELNKTLKSKIESKSHNDLINYHSLGEAAKLAIPTPDHYFPLLYTLGLQSNSDDIEFFNDKLVAGSLNMTSIKIG